MISCWIWFDWMRGGGGVHFQKLLILTKVIRNQVYFSGATSLYLNNLVLDTNKQIVMDIEYTWIL